MDARRTTGPIGAQPPRRGSAQASCNSRVDVAGVLLRLVQVFVISHSGDARTGEVGAPGGVELCVGKLLDGVLYT